MDYRALLDMATELGYRLAIYGAETYRIEESINRVLQAYGVESEVFAITNCLTVSIEPEKGDPLTRMRRIGYHGNDLDSVERYNALSRRLCAEHPDPAVGAVWLRQTDAQRVRYSLPMCLLGNFLGAFGFALFFGGTPVDGLLGGFCGILVGLMNELTDRLNINYFFRVILAAFTMALPAYLFHTLGWADHVDAVIIGALMILVPGLLFINAMRDVIFGDTNSGLNRMVQVVLIAIAIALGTASAWKVLSVFTAIPPMEAAARYPLLLECGACIIGAIGFSILFNVHGWGMWLCVLGSVLSWAVYCVLLRLGTADTFAFFVASVFASCYSELMARIRKYPAISYLVVSIFPLLPGGDIYYTINYAVQGDMVSFSQRGMHTIAVAGSMAVGILLAATAVRLISSRKRGRKG